MTAPNDSPADEPRAPAPRRRLRALARRHRFATSILALLTLALLLRLAWGWYAHRQLAAALDDLRRGGQPTSEREFVDEVLPASDNAWLFFKQAILALKTRVDSPRNGIVEFPNYPPYGAQWESMAAASERAHAAAFPAARRARRLPRSQLPPVAPGPLAIRPEWNESRHLANTVIDGAQYAHLRGDDAEAVERLLDVLHLARCLRQDPHFVSHLVGIGIDALGCDGVQHVVPTLRLDPSPGATPATAAQARQLIDALLDEKDNRTQLTRALAGERASALNILNAAAAETWAIRPLVDRTALRWTRQFDALLDAAGNRNAQEARELGLSLQQQNAMTAYSLPAARPMGNSADLRYSRWFETGGPESLTRAIEQFHRASAERRATAFIVAARLYRHDHGHWPQQAADLVPDYLAAVPVDPFRADDGPLGYVLQKGALPDGGDRPLVYFETARPGADIIDVEPMYGWQQDPTRRVGWARVEFRQYRDVSYWLPKTRRFDVRNPPANAATGASTQAVNNDPKEPDAPGDDAKDDDAPDRPPDQ